ncbi:hypothetical protein NPIL_192921 [Nephila pilipes]|uniref:Uncharacterized protein n=1 Tax=Nephila pilipes TaxID=299642 RepID=A0A8X6PF28_NEPPI|nr:hypothetical protein NPIL_192921 [Nephila pilipes]
MFDHSNAEVCLMNGGIEMSHDLKWRCLTSFDSSLKSIQSTEPFLSSELQHDLFSHLSVTDQQEIDRLKDNFRNLKQVTMDALHEETSLEAEKNNPKFY